MHIIKLNAIDSTNSFLRQLSIEEQVEDLTVVVAQQQTQGRGQMGALWYSEIGKNLMCSVFKTLKDYKVSAHFYISVVVSLSVYEALKALQLRQLKIKWPNDILSEQQKICGILIENVIKYNDIQSSIIGIGLNVNQTNFKNLPKASSIKNLTGKIINPEDILKEIVLQLKYFFSLLENKDYDDLITMYTSRLYRKDKPSTFKGLNGKLFSGIIKGVTIEGQLKVLVENDYLQTFDLKEIQLLS